MKLPHSHRGSLWISPLIQLILIATKSWKWLLVIVCFPAQMQREGAVLKINQSSVMFLSGWGSPCVKLSTSIVFCPMRPQVESQWKGGLFGCIMVRRVFRAKRWCQLHRSSEKGAGVNVMQQAECSGTECVWVLILWFVCDFKAELQTFGHNFTVTDSKAMLRALSLTCGWMEWVSKINELGVLTSLYQQNPKGHVGKEKFPTLCCFLWGGGDICLAHSISEKELQIHLFILH